MPEIEVTYYVIPSDKGIWNVNGRQVAKNADLGQLKTQKRDGTFQAEYTYGKDPHPPEG